MNAGKKVDKIKNQIESIIDQCSTTELRSMLTQYILDLPQVAKFLGVSQSRAYRILNIIYEIDPVIGSNLYLLRDIEKVKAELEKKRKIYGTGWGSKWVFSQENVLTTLIDLYRENTKEIPLRDIINKIDAPEMDYSDKSIRVLCALRRLIDHGAVVRPKRGYYLPTKPDVDVQDQIPVTQDAYMRAWEKKNS